MTAVTVGIASLCGAHKIEECLEALGRQRKAPPFRIVVAYDPDFDGIVELQQRFPQVQFVSRPGCRAPIGLMALAAAEATGDMFLLTEDHCIPSEDWVRRLVEELQPGRAAVGGPIAAPPAATSAAWAFYFLDFFPYLDPLPAGPAPSLSVCNVAYRRADLEAIRTIWIGGFHEMAVHQHLVRVHGPLWVVPDALVTMTRRVGFRGGLREANGQARLFAAKRIELVGVRQRLQFLLLAPLLPGVLFFRRARRAAAHAESARRFGRALPAMIGLILAWSWGEWMGYLTGRPGRLVLAPDVGHASTTSSPSAAPPRTQP